MFMCIDRVFRGDSQTREVYDEGIKDIALSVVGGINCKFRLMSLVETLLHSKSSALIDNSVFNMTVMGYY